MIRSEIEDLVEELQSVSLDMDPEQIANTHTLCAVLEDITAESCRQVIRAAGTDITVHRILSPACLPIPPPGHTF